MSDLVSEILTAQERSVVRDVDAMLWSMRLQRVRRYFGQPFWEDETRDTIYADRLIASSRLETVAEHSWNVADAVLLVAWRFPYVNDGHALRLAVLHDKMEIAVGDANPLGRDGTGRKGHAFDKSKELSKDQRERVAIERYLGRLNPAARPKQEALLTEALECRSPESRLVKALDKMQALVFILLQKGGDVTDAHLTFLLRFTVQNNCYFPPVASHNADLLRRIFRACARTRDEGMAQLLARVAPAEELDLHEVKPGLDQLTDTARSNVQSTAAPPMPSKKDRLSQVFKELELLPRARSGIEAFAQLMNCLNRVEDEVWKGHWQPPRHVPPGTATDRMYPIAGDSIYPVTGWPVDVLVTYSENIYISITGAIEVQKKRLDEVGGAPWKCPHQVIFGKPGADGHGVWYRPSDSKDHSNGMNVEDQDVGDVDDRLLHTHEEPNASKG